MERPCREVGEAGGRGEQPPAVCATPAWLPDTRVERPLRPSLGRPLSDGSCSPGSCFVREQSTCDPLSPGGGWGWFVTQDDVEQLCSLVCHLGQTPRFLVTSPSPCISGAISIFQCLLCIVRMNLTPLNGRQFHYIVAMLSIV